jgi:hypothetical protein
LVTRVARDLGHVHRLLGAGRAAEGAVVEADAALHVARVVLDRPAEAARALEEEMAVAPERVLVVRLDVQDAFGLLEVRLHALRPEPLEPEHPLPVEQDSLRRAPAHAAVDDGRAADAAPLGEEDRRPAEDHGRAGVAVEPPDHGPRIGGEGLGAVELPLLEHQDIEPRVAEPRRRRRPARPRADDDGVGDEHLIARERRAVGDVRVGDAVLGRSEIGRTSNTCGRCAAVAGEDGGCGSRHGDLRTRRIAEIGGASRVLPIRPTGRIVQPGGQGDTRFAVAVSRHDPRHPPRLPGASARRAA